MKPTRKNSKAIYKKPIVILVGIFIGFLITGIIGLVFFDVDFTEDQKLTMAIQDIYPTQESLQTALDNGEFNYEDLSNELKAYMYFEGSGQEEFNAGGIFVVPP